MTMVGTALSLLTVEFNIKEEEPPSRELAEAIYIDLTVEDDAGGEGEGGELITNESESESEDSSLSESPSEDEATRSNSGTNHNHQSANE